MTKASDKEECEGCGHRNDSGDGFCYMFDKAPSALPCAQHDMYAKQRELNGRKMLGVWRSINGN